MNEYISREAAIIGLAASSLTPRQIDDAAEALQLVPAADVVAVRHGMWLRTPTGWVYCSMCGEEPPEETNARTKYCPNCEAVMDGGQDDV